MGKCPACLAFGVTTDAVAVVAGTEFCATHAVNALAAQPLRAGPNAPGGRPGPPANYQVMSLFSPPAPESAPDPGA